MEFDDITSWIDANVPQVILLIGGLLALLIAAYYVKDKESGAYKVLLVTGVLFGVLMAITAAARYGEWHFITCLLVILAAFTLIIRPFRDIHIAVIVAIMAMVIMYVYLGSLNGADAFGVDLTPLSEGWIRIIIAFVVGAFIYMVLNFAEALMKLVGKILNFWPILAIFGIICIMESAAIFLGYASFLDMLGIDYRTQTNGGIRAIQYRLGAPFYIKILKTKRLNYRCGL